MTSNHPSVGQLVAIQAVKRSTSSLTALGGVVFYHLVIVAAAWPERCIHQSNFLFFARSIRSATPSFLLTNVFPAQNP